jgi:predicted transcriptional regulator
MSFKQAAFFCQNEDLKKAYQRMRDTQELRERFANQAKTNEGAINELMEEIK